MEIVNNLLKNFIIILVPAALIVACGTKNDCFTSDNVKQLKMINHNNRSYSIYLRISGFQEKESFYELYEGVPSFDDCGKPSIQAKSTVHIDSIQGSVSRLILDGEKLYIVFKKDSSDNANFEDVKIEIKKR